MEVDRVEAEDAVSVQFKTETGEKTGTVLDVSKGINVAQLRCLLDSIAKQKENVQLRFTVNQVRIIGTLRNALKRKPTGIVKRKPTETETVHEIVYSSRAAFRVKSVGRCTASIPGPAEAILSACFSPDGRYLASGSGDKIVRLYDVNTETPQFKCQGHHHWVLCIAWSPDGKKLASGCKSNRICVWNPETGKQMGKTLLGHKFWINSIAWEPLHRNAECRRFVSASKDGTVRMWDVVMSQTVMTISAHNKSVTCVKWGGTGLIYTASQDCTVKVWRDSDGVLCRTLQDHGHWVNTLALNTDYVLRTGPFDPSEADVVYREVKESAEELSELALQRYNDAKGSEPERLVSGSDDFTLFLWNPETDKKPIARMTGHQQLVNDVKFSPDMTIIASASFDKSVRLWNGKTGVYLSSLRGHVQYVYQIAWAADSCLLVSGSADSTLKVWDIPKQKLLTDLPGHSDEVFTVDWSPDGQRVVSGGRDKVLKIWRR